MGARIFLPNFFARLLSSKISRPVRFSTYFLACCIERGIELVHIESGKPVQNPHVESFHGRLREECLNVSCF
jgi:transposase InsO family protein